MNTLQGLVLVRENKANSSLRKGRSLSALPFGRLADVLGLFLLALLLGCEQPAAVQHPETKSPPPKTEKPRTPELPKRTDDPPMPFGAKRWKTQDIWHSNYLQGKKIGHRHTQVLQMEINSKRFTETFINEEQSLLRFGEKVTLEVKARQLVNQTGAIVEFSYELPLGNKITRVQGKVEAGKLTYWSENQPEKAPEQIPCPADTLGFSGLEDSLAKSPMKPGEARTIKMLQLPPLPLIGTVKLQAKEEELTTLPAGEVRLLRVDETIELPGGGSILCHFWTDPTGQILKYSVPPVQQETFLVTPRQALDDSEAFAVDLGSDMLVRLEKPLDKPHQKQQASYRVELKSEKEDGVLRRLLPAGLSQQIRPLDVNKLQVTVLAIRPDYPAKLLEAQPQPTTADSQSSSLVESDAAEIKALAQEAVREQQAPAGPNKTWAEAKSIEKFVHGYLTQKNYSQAFSSAAEVARTREGDCTEHAVLVAALCRARGIPARVAYGLVYVASEQAFAFHMWDEVWIGDRWIPLDATLALGGIGAGHIKFGHSSLSDLSALLELLPVMQLVGRLEITVGPVETRP